jgi:hypothetical protein
MKASGPETGELTGFHGAVEILPKSTFVLDYDIIT